MKKLFSICMLAFLLGNFASAQKFGYINSQEILEQMEDYKAAEAFIEQESQKWQKELEDMYANIEKMYKAYEEEAVLLPEDLKKQRQEAIFNEERKAKEFKKEKFGYDGALYKLQDEKIKPVQDKLFDAVEQMAKEKRLNVVFDKASNTGMIYSDATFDRTADVKSILGLQ